MAYFKKLLIANRGEIARRIIRTCNKLGIDTVAIYSDADKEAPFVHEATEAVALGGSLAKDSYLNIDKVIQIAKAYNVEAIHPGYGFLSENANFVQKCEEAGIVFIGPSKETMEVMGSKLLSRKEMMKAGVPVVPGTEESLQSLDQAKEVAAELGYPLMLKASAGGGGIGMKLVQDEKELVSAYETTKTQAANFFSDDQIFLEKWIEQPRHIEVQIAADTKGNVIHLFERECSVQRRHQKVVEESPSPFLTEEIRQNLLDAAIKGVKHINYTNLGTMEFIFDKNGNFYFLEMNTRLQVEHPVTEEITNLDLVEWQIKIAANEPLELEQEAVQRQGHAIECRLYAEDSKTYFPSPGKITKLVLPDGEARFDFGVEEGTDVTPFYDPMIGKIIVHGNNRKEAIKKCQSVLKEIELEGITCNLDLLQRIMKSDAFMSGNYTTKFLDSFNK